MSFVKYQKPSTIVFEEVEAKKDGPKVSDAKMGVTFLRDGAVCMRVEVSIWRILSEAEKSCGFSSMSADCRAAVHKYQDHAKTRSKDATAIINLQTGRVFFANDSDPIEWIKVTMSVDAIKS